jgi:hypothetical protein
MIDEKAIEGEASDQQAKLSAPRLGITRTVMDVCSGSPVPSGWIKVNDYWSATSCGNPSSIVYNVSTIERYNNKSVGAVMNVCAGAPTPSGWVIVDTYWSPTSCGHPSSIVRNMKQIRRVS